jgi:hypothetical protein
MKVLKKSTEMSKGTFFETQNNEENTKENTEENIFL